RRRLAGAGGEAGGERAGESPLAALGRLLERVPDQIFGREYTLLITEFADDEDADYTYGVDHPIAELSVHDRDEIPALVRVIGTGAAGEAVGPDTATDPGGTLAVV